MAGVLSCLLNRGSISTGLRAVAKLTLARSVRHASIRGNSILLSKLECLGRVATFASSTSSRALEERLRGK